MGKAVIDNYFDSVCECFIFKLLRKLTEFNLRLQISRWWDLSTCVAPEWASIKVEWRRRP